MFEKIPAEQVDYQQVEYWAKRGMSAAQIARRLRLDASVLESEAFNEAVEDWRAEGISEVADALFDRVREGNLRAITFYLKAIGGWRESARVGESGNAPRWATVMGIEE